MRPSPSLEDVRRALVLENFDTEAAHKLMAPRPRPMRRPPDREGKAKQGGVLLLLYPSSEEPGVLNIVLTKRTDTVGDHKGQISFPGGGQEPGEPLAQTALREANEELEIDPSTLTVLGKLSKIYIVPSDFEVHPLVAYTPQPPNFRGEPREVAEVLEMPLPVLLDEKTKVVELWKFDEIEMDVPFYNLNGHAVWGATAIILSEFERRLRHVLHEGQSA